MLLLKILLLCDAAMVGLILWLADNDASPVVVISLAAITATVSIVTAVLAYLSQRNSKEAIAKSQEIKILVDGKMTELLEASKKADNLEGAERERVEARARGKEGDKGRLE